MVGSVCLHERAALDLGLSMPQNPDPNMKRSTWPNWPSLGYPHHIQVWAPIFGPCLFLPGLGGVSSMGP